MTRRELYRKAHYKRWYAENKDRLLASRRQRYAEDPEYRERICASRRMSKAKRRDREQELQRVHTRYARLKTPFSVEQAENATGIPSERIRRLVLEGVIPFGDATAKEYSFTPEHLMYLTYAASQCIIETDQGSSLDEQRFLKLLNSLWKTSAFSAIDCREGL